MSHLQGASGGLSDRDFFKALKEISKHAIIGSDKHTVFCYLMKPLVSRSAEASKLGSMAILKIYDVMKAVYGRKDGIALIWFVLDLCKVSKDHTDSLKRFVLEDLVIDNESLITEFRFRQLLGDIATMLAANPESAQTFVSCVAQQHLFEPIDNFEPVELKSLLKLLQTTCERDMVGPEPEQIETLKEMLDDAERTDIRELVAKFKPDEPIKVTTGDMLHTIYYSSSPIQ